MSYQTQFATRIKGMGASAIREILKVVSQPGMVSLAGGIPAPETFPIGITKKLVGQVFEKYGARALQYDPTEGFPPLRKALLEYLKTLKIPTRLEEVTVTSGSQGALDGLGKIFLNKDDRMAVEAPTYLGAIQAFNPYEPKYVSLKTDDKGLIPESLERVLRTQKIKFVYLVPTFQNPTGRTIPLKRRVQIAKLIKKYRALLIEDDPYGALRYRGQAVPPIKSLAMDNVVYTSTLSKLFAPGLRIGFVVAPKKISRWLVLAKQGVDLHTSTFNQALAAEYIKGGYLKKQTVKNIKIYKPKQEAMLHALEKYFPANFSWSKPEGGMFIWVEGPKGFDAVRAYRLAIKKKVAFVPGKFFFTQKGQGLQTMRLNYSMADEKTIYQAIKTLGQILQKK